MSESRGPPGFRPKAKDNDVPQASTSAPDSAQAPPASASQPEAPSPSPLTSSIFANFLRAMGLANRSEDDKTKVYTTGIPNVLEITMAPKDQQRYVIGGYAERNPDMLKPHRCNDRLEDFILAVFYATSTPTPFRDFSYTFKQMYWCMRSNVGEEPTEPYKFLDERAYQRRIRRAMNAYHTELAKARSADVKEEKTFWAGGEGGEGGSKDS